MEASVILKCTRFLSYIVLYIGRNSEKNNIPLVKGGGRIYPQTMTKETHLTFAI